MECSGAGRKQIALELELSGAESKQVASELGHGKAETEKQNSLNVDGINKAGSNQISLGVKQFDETESKQMGLSVNQLDGIRTKQLTLDVNQAAENEGRGGKQTDCMSGAGRVSDISHTPATQYLDYCWNVFEET